MYYIKEQTPLESFTHFANARFNGEKHIEILCENEYFRQSIIKMFKSQKSKIEYKTKNGNLIIEL